MKSSVVGLGIVAVVLSWTISGCATVKDLADMAPSDTKCSKFLEMSPSEQSAVIDSWKAKYEGRMSTNPMYSSLDASGKTSFLIDSFSMYCSESGHEDDKLSSLTSGF